VIEIDDANGTADPAAVCMQVDLTMSLRYPATWTLLKHGLLRPQWPPAAPTLPATLTGVEEEKLLVADEAASRLGTTKDWIYRQRRLPFAVKLGKRMTRYSASGISKWIRNREGRG
jgi:predicted DNA-binding transcriptional regulator AlpA